MRYWRLSPDAKSGLIFYCQRLERSGYPVLLTLSHIAFLCGVPSSLVGGVVDRPQRYYRVFEVPKRRGGVRSLSAPTPFLAHVQRWILTSILARMPVHSAAHGFVPRRGIISNAEAHRNSPAILKMDIADFFGSITRQDVEKVFANAGYTPKLTYYLSRITTLYGRLPQGAPSSPAISNILMNDFDVAVSAFCESRGLIYTRYADDITISGDNIGSTEINRVQFELGERGLQVASEKTRLSTKSQKQIVTGISVSSGCLKLPRDRRRKLRQIVHYIETYGIQEHIKREGIRDPIYRYRLAGELNYWLQIEPENKTAKRGLLLIAPKSLGGRN
ncbi:MAG TPA: reverse transcriptase domain-containing protein [Devosiaceae bacterium]|nr:reverse transcriptase domain-containing protein [Devosiaceae bacterium]